MKHALEVTRVRQLLNAPHDQLSYLVFLNRLGEIDIVSEPGNDDDTWILLGEKARTQSGGPFFEIVATPATYFGKSVFRVINALGEVIVVGDKALDALDEAVDYAIEERKRFYAEKEAEFGPSARPVAS